MRRTFVSSSTLSAAASPSALRRIEDVTSDWAVINVQGPSSLALLRRLVPGVADLQFSRSVEARLGEAGVRLLRLSYVGELGYEVVLQKVAS